MMATFEIPLTPDSQTFTIALAGTSYRLTVRWSSAVGAWVLDIATLVGTPLLAGLPLVANVDLLAPYGYMNFGGQLIAQTDNASNEPPTYENLGITSHLYFVTP
jgi:hypothetical protein